MVEENCLEGDFFRRFGELFWGGRGYLYSDQGTAPAALMGHRRMGKRGRAVAPAWEHGHSGLVWGDG